MQAKSWQTSIAGIVQALGVLALTYGLMGQEEVAAWTGVVMAVVGSVWNGLASRDDGVTSEGTVAPKKTTLLLLALVPACVVGIGGCTNAGGAARSGVLAPWAQEAWPSIEGYALRGIQDMTDDGELTDQTAAFPRETVRLFGEAVDALGAR